MKGYNNYSFFEVRRRFNLAFGFMISFYLAKMLMILAILLDANTFGELNDICIYLWIIIILVYLVATIQSSYRVFYFYSILVESLVIIILFVSLFFEALRQNIFGYIIVVSLWYSLISVRKHINLQVRQYFRIKERLTMKQFDSFVKKNTVYYIYKWYVYVVMSIFVILVLQGVTEFYKHSQNLSSTIAEIENIAYRYHVGDKSYRTGNGTSLRLFSNYKYVEVKYSLSDPSIHIMHNNPIAVLPGSGHGIYILFAYIYYFSFYLFYLRYGAFDSRANEAMRKILRKDLVNSDKV